MCDYPRCEEDGRFDAEIVSEKNEDDEGIEVALCLKHYCALLRYNNSAEYFTYSDMLDRETKREIVMIVKELRQRRNV